MSIWKLSLYAVFLALWAEWFLFPIETVLHNIDSAIRGKTVLITGASQGIGKALAEEYVKLGVGNIVLASRSDKKLAAVKDEFIYLASPSTRILTFAVDLSSEAECRRLIDFCNTTLGGIDYLVLNHITDSHYGLWMDNAEKSGGHSFLPKMFEVNTFSYIWLATAALDMLKYSSGQIVVVSSLAGLVGTPNTAVYSATKHALHGFFNSFRAELSLMNILNVGITIAPIGATDTEGAQHVKKKLGSRVQWDPPAEAALAILRGAALRKREVFHPHHLVFPTSFIYRLNPTLIDFFLRQIYSTA
jgi:short-subunit dehydrogenase